jgi:hypothetical protein
VTTHTQPPRLLTPLLPRVAAAPAPAIRTAILPRRYPSSVDASGHVEKPLLGLKTTVSGAIRHRSMTDKTINPALRESLHGHLQHPPQPPIMPVARPLLAALPPEDGAGLTLPARRVRRAGVLVPESRVQVLAVQGRVQGCRVQRAGSEQVRVQAQVRRVPRPTQPRTPLPAGTPCPPPAVVPPTPQHQVLPAGCSPATPKFQSVTPSRKRDS